VKDMNLVIILRKYTDRCAQMLGWKNGMNNVRREHSQEEFKASTIAGKMIE